VESTKSALVPRIKTMRAEGQAHIEQIKQALDLLRRFL
jgi:hypothetical protein